MKIKLKVTLISCATSISALGQGLYYIPNDTEESIPIVWSAGVNAVYDSNTNPTAAGPEDETFSLNPFVGLSFVSQTPQTTWDVFARLGMVYYLERPTAPGSEEIYPQTNAGVNLTHRFNERLRLVSRNAISYQLEPEYSYGFAASRQAGEYLFWNTDNALGYRWTERFATYTGFKLTGLEYQDTPNSDRFTWMLYNQFRYQLSPQTVATSTYRYSQTEAGGVASDSTNQYLLVGLEHRFSPNTIFVGSAGAQFRDYDGANGDTGTNAFFELTLRSQVNQQFTVSAFARYSAEFYDNVQTVGGVVTEYDNKPTLRIGGKASYQLSQDLSFFGGLNLINTNYEDGRGAVAPFPAQPDQNEFLINAYIGASLKLTDYLYGSLTYNFTNGDSDLPNRNYDRSRISIGLNAEF